MMEYPSWSGLGATIASFMFLWTMMKEYLPRQFDENLKKYTNKVISYVYPYVEIKFHEYSGEHFQRSEAYTTIKAYLGETASKRANKLKGEIVKNSTNLVLSMDDHEQVTDEFGGAKLWWSSITKATKATSISLYPTHDEQRFYKLVFHCRQRELIMDKYLPHVMREGKAVAIRNRRRRLFTNKNMSQGGYKKEVWNSVAFEHPATFDTLAMDPNLKEEIIEDLKAFTEGKDYYKRIGKAWKRGYLLFGPPGTGKSTMIGAMANFLDYDVYDLELTAVKDNTDLRKLLINTTSKSIIVIEDIDCSLDLSGKRKNNEKPEGVEKDDEKSLPPKPHDKDESSKVTLSGLLNFIDGLWSSCGEERLIIFTTNHVEKLDPALIRRGRMDKHIKLSYCRFEEFKVLAKNYLGLNSHPLFGTIRVLMEDTNITPADVAENLMLKSTNPEKNAETCLEDLIQSLHKVKEENKLKEEAAQVEIRSVEQPLEPKKNDITETAAVANGHC